MTIEIPIFDYRNNKILSGTLPEIIILHDKTIEHKWKIKVLRTVDGVDKELLFHGVEFVLKSCVMGASAYWSQEEEAYNVEIITASTKSSGFCVIFDSLPKAIEFKDKIQSWLTK